jgi:hypothetical protein
MDPAEFLNSAKWMKPKSTFRAGNWLNVHEPDDREDIGLEIGRMAHSLFPGGVLVEEAPWEHAKAVTRTAALMADRSVPAIFEAAFEHSGVRIRVDILERLLRGYWGLREAVTW